MGFADMRYQPPPKPQKIKKADPCPYCGSKKTMYGAEYSLNRFEIDAKSFPLYLYPDLCLDCKRFGMFDEKMKGKKCQNTR